MKSYPRIAPDTKWIWRRDVSRPFNRFVCFRKTFTLRAAVREARLHITADSRYEVHVNGTWIGHGPARSWPSPWPVDEYDVRSLLRPGRNVIAVLVQHHGISTFQYLHAEAGLLAQLDIEGAGRCHIRTDRSWRAVESCAYAWPTPRISPQQAWEEQFDARNEPGGGRWREASFDDRAWPHAEEVRSAYLPPHERLEPRSVPMLTSVAAAPARVLHAEAARPAPITWSLNVREILNSQDRTANFMHGRLLLAARIHSPCIQKMRLQIPHAKLPGQIKLNGRALHFDPPPRHMPGCGIAEVLLHRGDNTLLVRLKELDLAWSVTMNAWTDSRLRVSWISLGPFALAEQDYAAAESFHSDRFVSAEKTHPDATPERHEDIWRRGVLTDEDVRAPFAHSLPPTTIAPVDVYAVCASDLRSGQARIRSGEAVLHDDTEWATVHPAAGADVRFLLDFGREIVGFQEFEIDAPAGTNLDVINFEHIQRDGRFNYSEGMNNSFRYTCREGIQRYRTFLRRGFRYTWCTLRNFTRPVRIRFIRAIISTYPTVRQGDFACSDPMLDRIWQTAAHTLQCCAEDTYTDCPTYEQALWVGDARHEALVDLVVNGDPRLSRHSWLVAARSLERSSLVESHVPSGWKNILPAWTFLWMCWAQEHYMLTGDRAFGMETLPYLERNFRGICRHINSRGLFEIRAWNMLDWAPMDTPNRGIVTHQNCLLVRGLCQTAELAQSLDRPELAAQWRALARRVRQAVNKHLWSERRNAFVDCLHADGSASKVFSQQTNTMAYICGVASGARAHRCREIMESAPRGFITAGSPFFIFFVLEGLEREGQFDRMIQTIRTYWGRQTADGATTFWEKYVSQNERKTRSHCHGWSAAPAYFLGRCILGIRPLLPGYAEVLVAPHPGRLRWAQGRVPTPRGIIECRWERAGDAFMLNVTLPHDAPMKVELPGRGRVTVEKGEARRVTGCAQRTLLQAYGRSLRLTLQQGATRKER